MKLTFYNIYNNFKDYSRLTNVLELSSQIPLLEAKLIVKNQKIFKSNFLYVGTTSFIVKNKIKFEPCHVIFIDDLKENFPMECVEGCSYVILEGSCDLFQVFNQISEIFTENNLLNNIKNSTSLNSIAETASQLLDNPVVIIDSSYRVLANSETSKISDKYWVENIKKGYCSYDFIAYVRNMESIKTSLNNAFPFQVICAKSPVERWVSKIFVGGKLVGYIVVLLCESPMEASNKNILPSISNAISKYLEKTSNNLSLENTDYKNFFMDLLDNNISDEKALNEKFKSYNIALKSKFLIIALNIDNYDSTNNIPNYLSYELNKLFHKKIHIYYENYVVILYDYDNDPFISLEHLQQLESFALENHIFLGISNSFNNLLLCKNHFNEAVNAIKLGKELNKLNTINYYKSFQFYDFLYNSSKLMEIDSFLHPSLKTLKAFDAENNTELYKTLYIYLTNNKNAVFTAKQLFVHRNTIKYRLDKIAELTHINFKNEEEIFHIYFSYKCFMNKSLTFHQHN